MKIQNNQTLNTWLFIAVVAVVAWFAGVSHCQHQIEKAFDQIERTENTPPRGWSVIRTSGVAQGRHGSRGSGAVGGVSGCCGGGVSQSGANGPGQGQTGSQGGRYSMSDPYQPWPQAEVQQFAKPHWTPWKGD